MKRAKASRRKKKKKEVAVPTPSPPPPPAPLANHTTREKGPSKRGLGLVRDLRVIPDFPCNLCDQAPLLTEFRNHLKERHPGAREPQALGWMLAHMPPLPTPNRLKRGRWGRVSHGVTLTPRDMVVCLKERP